jgi:hypothetical protein
MQVAPILLSRSTFVHWLVRFAFNADCCFFPRDDYRETLGTFLCKPTLRPTENFFLEIPVERVRQMKPQAQRLLGYGVCEPGIGFMHYQDPMRALFGVEDEETVDM